MSEESENSIIRIREYTYTADEQVQMWRGAMIRWADYALTVIWIAAIPGVMSIVIAMRGGTPWLGVTLCIVVGIGGVVYPALRVRQIRRRCAALEAAGKLVSQRHEFDGQFITTYLSDGQEYRLELKDLMCYVVSNNILYLYVAKKSCLAIPLRALESADDRQAVYGMLKTNGVAFNRNHPKGGWK